MSLLPKPVMLIRAETIARRSGVSEDFLKARLNLMVKGSTAYIMHKHSDPLSKVIIVRLGNGEVSINKLDPLLKSNDDRIELRSAGSTRIILDNTSSGSVKIVNEEGSASLNRESVELLRCGGNVIAVSKLPSKGKHGVAVSPITGDLTLFDDYKLRKGKDINLLALSKGRQVTLYIWNPLTGEATQFQLGKCELGDASCGVNICVIRCGNKKYSITLDGIHEIPSELTPLIKCGDIEYYYDEENKLITRYDKGILEPLTDIKPVHVTCLSDNELAIGSSNGVFRLHGNLLIKLIDRPVIDLKGSNSVIVYPGREGIYYVYNVDRATTSIVSATVCDVMNNDLLWCLVGEGDLIVLNPKEIVKPEVTVLRDRVDSGGYAIIRITPWFEGCKFLINGPVKTVNTVISGETAVISLRPKVLGWQGDVGITVKSPIHWLSTNVRISSSKPLMRSAELSRCNYIVGGRIKGTEDNFEVGIKLVLNWTAPEDPKILIDVGVNEFRISKKAVSLIKSELAGGIREYNVYLRGRLRSENIVIPIVLKAVGACGEQYELGKVTVVPKNYVRDNPLVNAKLTIDRKKGITIIRSSLSNVRINVECRNKTYSGLGSVEVKDCRYPAFIREHVEENGFEWSRLSILRPALKPGKCNAAEFKVRLKERDINGIRVNELIVSLPEEARIKCGINEFNLTGAALKYSMKIKCEATHPSLIIVVYGYNNEGFRKVGPAGKSFLINLEGSVNDLMNDLRIYSLPILTNNVAVHIIRFEEVFKILLKEGVILAHNLLKHIINPPK